MTTKAAEVEREGWVPHVDDTYIGALGTVLERRRDGLLEIGLLTDERHKNLSGIVHGGVMMALVDRAIGINCREAGGGEPMATASLTVNFARAVKVGDFVEVACRLRRVGRNAIFADGEAHVGDRLVVTATGLWMKVRRRG
jgi:uncharacterized protein (TIGR00369 family)